MARIEREEQGWDQGFHSAGNWSGRLGRNEEQVRIERTERITEALKVTTFVSTLRAISMRAVRMPSCLFNGCVLM
jgi:hypothetical protein